MLYAYKKISWQLDMQKLRGQLDKLLNRKIEEPGFDISGEGNVVVAAAVELLHNQNMR